MSDHAPIAPSGLKRTRGCPGSLKACRGEQIPSDNSAANEGTVAHAFAESVLIGDGDYKHPLIDNEMIEGVKVYTDYCKSLSTTCAFVEQKVQIKAIHETDCYGTLDFGAINVPYLDIVDLKYGYRWVEPGGQLIAYAAGLLSSITPTWREQITHVRLHIVQPRGHHPGGPIRTSVLSIAELAEEIGRIRERVELALSDNPPLIVGEWCYKCPRLHDCPAAIATNYDYIDRALTIDDIKDVDIGVIGRDLIAIKRAEDNLKDRKVRLEEVLTHHLKTKGATPTHELASMLSNRKYKVSDERIAIAAQLEGVDPYDSKIKSPAQLEKAGVSKKTVDLLVERKPYKKLQQINFDNIQKDFKL